MSLLRSFLKHRLHIGLLVVMLATLAGGYFATRTKAQGQICRDIGNLTVCGDQEGNPGTGDLVGNIRIGPKGKPPVVLVTDYPSPDDPKSGVAAFIAGSESPSALFGSIELIGSPVSGPLVKSVVRRVPGGSNNELVDGPFIIDPITMVIRSAPDATSKIPPEHAHLFYEFPFIEQLGLTRMTSDLSPADKNKIATEFHLADHRFVANLPAFIQLPTDNPQAPQEVTLQVSLNKNGETTINITDFKVQIGGMTGNLKGVKMLPDAELKGFSLAQNGDKPVAFEAEVLEFSRTDNPNLPNLDASQPNLVFSIRGVQFKDGRFSVKGGAVTLPDWQISRAFKLSKQQISILTNDKGTATSMVISSTLSFPTGSAVTDSRTFPMAITIGLKEQPNGKVTTGITGTLLSSARPALDFGPLTISTPAKTELVFDPAQNFFGLKADQVTLKWDSNLGGGSGVQSGFKLGVDNKKNLVFGLGAGGGITLPSMKTKAVTLQLSGNLENTADLTTFKITGSAQIALPNNGSAKPSVSMFIRSGKNVHDSCVSKNPCVQRFQWKLNSFELKLAGFGLGIGGAEGTPDGGFTVATASLKMPVGVKSVGGSIKNLTVSGSGNVSLLGGSVELPPMQIGSFSLVGVKGSFAKTTTGYEFKGAGTVPLPGLEPNSGKKISGEVIVRTRPDGSFTGFGVSVEFNTGSPGIPIANTGMELTMLRGGFDVNSGTVKINVGMRASSQIRFGPVPAATAEGNASLQFNPFKVTANAKLSVLVIQVAQASIGIGHQQGFSGGPGFNVAFDINFILARGETKLRIGPVTLSNGQRKTVIAAEAIYTVGIKRSAIFPLMPPRDINVASLTFKGGTFKVKGKSETLGLLGRVKISIPFLPDPSLSIFVNLQDRKVDVTDTDDYKLIDAAQLRALAAQGVAGFSSQVLAPAEVGLQSFPGQILRQETLPVTLEHAGTALFGISYPPGSSPSLRLRMPDGTVLTEQSVAEGKVSFLRYTDSTTEPHELAFMLADAPAGTYSLIIDGAPTQYDTVSYRINEAPELSDLAVNCGGNPVAGVTVTCDGNASGAAATITWTMQDSDSENATVQVGYAPITVGIEGGEVDLSQFTPLAEGLPMGKGSFTWELGEVPSGVYALVVQADDGQSAPVQVAASTQIAVVDGRAPAAPANLVAEPLPGELLVRWSPGSEADLAGYEIGFGVVQPGVADSPANFMYTRDMGAKETSLESGDLYDAKLWGLTDDQEIFVGLRAYDRSGNQSDWSLLRARPWPLAPKGWTPIPDGELPAGAALQIAFDSPLALPLEGALPAGLFELRDAKGAAVAGKLERIVGGEAGDEVLGLRFVPARPLATGERYTAVLKRGLSSLDGRQLPADYRWSFQAVQGGIYLPMLIR